MKTRTNTGQVVRTAVVEVLTCDITVAGYTIEEARAVASVLASAAANVSTEESDRQHNSCQGTDKDLIFITRIIHKLSYTVTV